MRYAVAKAHGRLNAGDVVETDQRAVGPTGKWIDQLRADALLRSGVLVLTTEARPVAGPPKGLPLTGEAAPAASRPPATLDQRGDAAQDGDVPDNPQQPQQPRAPRRHGG